MGCDDRKGAPSRPVARRASRSEVAAVLRPLQGPVRFVCELLYGSGLRLLEALTLRIKDVDFDRGEVRVRDGKGQVDRVTMLPSRMRSSLVQHLEGVRRQHEVDVLDGAGHVALPDGLSAK
jgi:site-specific recombinase XerD